MNRVRMAVAVVILLALTWLIKSSRDPTYKGKPLGFWLQGYDVSRSDVNGPAWRMADAAVTELGTNAIPPLLRMLGMRSLVGVPVGGCVGQSSDVAAQASLAFRALGENGRGAVPKLIKLHKSNLSLSPEFSYHTARALGYVGVPAHEAVPVILIGLTNTDVSLREISVWALGRIHAHSELAVPALLACLRDPVAKVRADAAVSLRQFGTLAAPCSNAIASLLRDTDAQVRREATNTLDGIAARMRKQAEPVDTARK